MFGRENRTSGGNSAAQSKSRLSSKVAVITVGILSVCWCIYITARVQHSSVVKSSNVGKIERRHPLSGTKGEKINPPHLAEVRSGAGLSDPRVLPRDVPPVSGGIIHVVFSTDCTFYQDWQTLMVFHSALEVGQEGPVTRIASGCSEAKKKILTAMYSKLYPQYHVHFTPDFKTDKGTGESYDFYNKPYGVEHWLDNAQPSVPDGVVVAIIDPDMIFMRPITTKIKEDNTILLPGAKDIPSYIKKGVPAAQQYGLGAPWATETSKNFNRTAICGEKSPCMDVTESFGGTHYSVGPPYLLERSDLKRLVGSWVQFVPRVYVRYPELLAEMYAYSMAGAHEQLPHFSKVHYMVSNTFANDEAWPWIDALGDDVCEKPVTMSKKPPDSYTGIRQRRFYPGKPLPTFLHLCQFFRAGELGFHKKRLKPELLDCDFQMLIEPSSDLGKVNYKNRDGEILPLSKTQARRNAFSLNVAHRSINSMLEYYKKKMCPPGTFIETNKSINVVHWPGDTTYDRR